MTVFSRPIPAAAACAVLLALLPLSSAPAEGAPAPSFDVFEFRVQGNTVLPAESIERAVYPYLGPGRQIADVESARAALEKSYRDAGYGTVLVDVPEQRVDEGIVTLQVVQAPVAKLRVVGAMYYSQQRILDRVPGLAEGEVPNFNTVQAQLASVNTGADRRVTPLLRPGKVAGTTEVDLQVEDRLPLHGSIELNNRQSPNTTPLRLQASLRYDNLWQREHSLGLQAQISPQNTSEVQALSASYTVPEADGLWVFSGVLSNSDVVAGIGDSTVLGKGGILGARRIVVLDGSPALTQSLSLGVDYKNFKEDVALAALPADGSGASTTPATGISTPIHYLPFSIGYNAARDDADGRWIAGAGLNFAIRGLGSNEADFANKRFGASGNYSYLKLDLAREQKLPEGLSLYGKLDGQLTGQPLIANEQFTAGGLDSVRGYLEAAAVGDSGLHGTLELRTPELAGRLAATFQAAGAPTGADDAGPPPLVSGLRLHAFAEGAHLLIYQALPQQQSRFSLLSAGVGLRLQTRDSARFALDLGWPLRTLGDTRRGDTRLHASGAFEF